VAIAVSLVAVPLAAFADEVTGALDDWKAPLLPYLHQLQGLRAEHGAVIEELRAQQQSNRDLLEQIKAELGGFRPELAALAGDHRSFVESEVQPLRQQVVELRRTMAEAAGGGDLETARAIREQLADLMARLRELNTQAAAMRQNMRQLQELWGPKLRIVREMRALLAPLLEQRRELQEETREAGDKLRDEWEKFRDHASKQQTQPCIQCLVRIIELKTELIGLTGELLSVTQEEGQILQDALEKLQSL